MVWLLIGEIVLVIAAIIAAIWAWREDYISFDLTTITDSFRLDGLKDMVVTIFSRPVFILLYLIFVIVPIWILGDMIAKNIPLYYKLIISFAGIFVVNWIMTAKGIE